MRHRRWRIAIVCSEFNGEITSRMLDEAMKQSLNEGADVVNVCKVPGAFDMPLFIDRFLSMNDVDAVVTLGAIVKGDTDHDDVIARVLASAITELSLKYGKPVALGVSGPGMTWEQAERRAEEYGRRAVTAAVSMAETLRKLSDRSGKRSGRGR
ncbi:MAG: 6,7-dimethyl-8-ribityllumazine synthase [Thermoplasmata archaeon]|nr:6,7-dimethyl-8-ribityllumazine synthase [Candidatus Sysuiplasma acidicola]